MKPLNPIVISGREVLPLVEGGKGISISNGESSGAWAARAASAPSPASMPTATTKRAR